MVCTFAQTFCCPFFLTIFIWLSVKSQMFRRNVLFSSECAVIVRFVVILFFLLTFEFPQDRLVSLDSAEDFIKLAKEKYPKKEG